MEIPSEVAGDGVKDAGEAGAGAATNEREVGLSSECDRLAVFLGHKTLLCFVNRAVRSEEAAGTLHRGSCGAGAGARAARTHNSSCV